MGVVRFLTVLLLCVTVFAKLEVTRSIDLNLSPNSSNEQCVEQLRNILSPGYLKTLGNMLSLSGKGMNQLGDFEACNKAEGLEYIVMNVRMMPQEFVIIRLGICSPSS